MVRTTLGAEVETSVTVSGSESIDFITKDRASTVASGGFDSIIIRPPAGRIYELLGLRVVAPAPNGASSGTHKFTIQSETNQVSPLQGISNHTDPVIYRRAYLKSATDTQDPPDTTAQALAPKGLRADESNGYNLFYKNDTDVAQTGAREQRLWVREIKVSE